MRTCVLDVTAFIPGLTKIIPDTQTHYYICKETSSIYTLQFPPDFLRLYGFYYREDWTNITSDMYDILVLCIPLLDYNYYTVLRDIMDKVFVFIKNQHFKHVILFDIHDYDYDPSALIENIPVNIYFKRNYSNTQTYASNVFPWPYCMFVAPCVLFSMVNVPHRRIHCDRHNDILFVGGLGTYTHIINGTVRDRRAFMQALHIQQPIVHIPELNEIDFSNALQEHKICLDLPGGGDPNKRTFEILRSGSVIMMYSTGLVWPFEPSDSWPECCVFNNPIDFGIKAKRLLHDKDIYLQTLQQQEYLVNKYMSSSYLTQYYNECIAKINI